MKFILKSEIEVLIKSNLLNDLTQDNNLLLDELEELAKSEIDALIGHKYNTTELFSKTGTDRNPFIKNIVINIILYYLHNRLTPTSIPIIREQLYKDAIGYLMQVASGKITPPIPQNEIPFSRSSESLFGYSPKLNNDLTY